MGVMTGNRNANANNGSGGEANEAPRSDAPALVVPFIRASDEHLQPGNVDVSVTAAQFDAGHDTGVHDIPAYGYISHLYILVEATAGAAGLNNAVAKEDAPWNVLNNIELSEPNGATIARFNSGFEMYLANKYGGYLSPGASDPMASRVFSDIATTGNFQFLLRLPVAVSSRDGVGALANQDSAGQFKLRLGVASADKVYSTEPDTKPGVRIRAWLAAYDQPEPTSAGVGNATEPPASGTTSFWTVQSGITVANGENTIELKRKGNYLRQIIFVLRTGTSNTARNIAEADWPDETRFLRDAFPARYYNDKVWRHIMFERTGFDAANEAANGLNDGVRFHDYMHEFDGALGRENRDLWQPTRGSTRLEIAGSFKDAATLDIITNDVAIAQNVFL